MYFLQAPEGKTEKVESQTREQTACRTWHEEREWRVTGSKFGEIANATCRRNWEKLCSSIYHKKNLAAPPIVHGRQYESIAIEKFQIKQGVQVDKAGLFICAETPYLAASPDGLVGDSHTVEVKCPYSGRKEMIRPHPKFFPFLECVEGKVKLKENCKHYAQVQGQLALTMRQTCYFVVYTFVDLFIQEIPCDVEYWKHSLLPKLILFYTKHYRPYIAKHL